ncbi:MAG: AraC family transcriptional regulator ligand-binding domain-containing protein [Fluviicoccus sp.]|uniref:AraC family transcriptional regulator n=1 Tax=Fluviicoccus sp. TaxID=2003552 RepID=UPI00272508A9|nr:AraC family transcriptional regulator [Fluviicoccus sp.]MDO8329620.1 AraC family transcriptional regulator ligand-binding domain-containing protein [Fluviicoccus sp.]
MKTTLASGRATLPGIFVSLLVDVVSRWSVTAEVLLAGSRIDPDILHTPGWVVDFGLYNQLLERAVKLTDTPGLGLFLGLQMTVSLHGIVGYTAMAGKTMRDAIDVFYRFGGLICPAIVPRLEVSGDTAYLYFDQPLPEYRMNDIAMAFLQAGCGSIGMAMTGRIVEGCGEVSFAEPAGFKAIAHLLPTGVRFGCAQNRLVFPASNLDLPLVMADPLAARIMREQCKLAMNEMMGLRRSLAYLVRELAYDDVQGFFNIEEVAQKLNVTERTLQRQLAEEDKTFRGIVEEIRQTKSAILLRNPDLSIKSISDQMGYSNTANFVRAFQRWEEKTPTQYREDLFNNR